MTEPVSPLPKPPLTWRPMVLWTAGMLLFLGLVWFIGMVVVSFSQVRATVEYLNASYSDSSWLEDPWRRQARAEADTLGRAAGAACKLGFYLRLPRSVAPHRRIAVLMLRECDAAEVVPFLISALRDEDKEVRSMAAVALRERSDPRMVEPFVKSLRDRGEDWGVRCSAVVGLGNTKDPRAVLALIEALEDNNDYVASNAARALGRIGDRRALGPLHRALRDSHPGVRSGAAWGLAEIGDPQSYEHLLPCLEEKADRDIRRSAAVGLGKIGNPQAIPLIEGLLKDECGDVRVAAAHALLRIGGNSEAALVALLESMSDRDSDARRRAAEILGELGTQAKCTEPALEQLLADQCPPVRQAAAEALKKIRGEEPARP